MLCLCQLACYALLGTAIYVVYRWINRKHQITYLRSQVERRRLERDCSIESVERVALELDQERAEEIVQWPYETLKNNLKNRVVSCEDVLKAYQRKSIEVNETTNCICLFIEDAISRARELDSQAADGSFVPPALFGVPVSIKECIRVKNMDSTLGYAQDLYKPSKEHSAIVQQLIRLGAIPFVHTNIPISLCAYGCSNGIYGTTSHPLRSDRVPGGSSGGEAALLAGGGSPLGIGTDIGGSIRIPASFCRLAGFKPSVNRMSHCGSVGGVPGRQLVIANEGPMAKDIDTCIDYLRLCWSDDEHYASDPFIPPVKWQEHLFSSDRPLTIGYYVNDGFIQAAPAYERVVLECVGSLRSLGHTLVPFQVPDASTAFGLLAAAVAADGGAFLNNKFNNDLVPAVCDFGFLSRHVPIRLQRLLSLVLPWPRLAKLLNIMPNNCGDQRRVFSEIDNYRHAFVVQMMKQHIDVIICPTMVLYPPEHHVPFQLMPACTYTSLYNLLDFAAGTVPIGHVNEADDAQLLQYPNKDPYDAVIISQCKGGVGFPIGVQVASPPYAEELALRVLKQLQDLKTNNL